MPNLIIKKIKYNFIFIFLKSIKTSLNTIIEIKKKRKDMNFFNLINFFIIRSIFGLTYFRNKIGYRKTEEVIEPNNFVYPLKKNKLLKDLVDNGFSDGFSLKNDCKENLLPEILENLQDSQVIFRDQNIKKKEILFKSKNDIDQYLIKSDIHMIKSSVNLDKTNLLNNIFINDFFVKLAKDYLNNDKITVVPYFFISSANVSFIDSANVNKLMSSSAQEYHFDVDFKKFFKIFVYFSDVMEKKYGSHIYIPKTHSNKRIQNIITSRFSTSEIEKNYLEKKIFLGEAGTTFVVDTFGIHKGSPVTKGTRLALIIEYGSGHFPFNKYHKYI